MPKTSDAHVTVTPERRGSSPFARLRPQAFSLVKIPFPFRTPVMQVKQQTISELPLSQDEGKCEAFGVWGRSSCHGVVMDHFIFRTVLAEILNIF